MGVRHPPTLFENTLLFISFQNMASKVSNLHYTQVRTEDEQPFILFHFFKLVFTYIISSTIRKQGFYFLCPNNASSFHLASIEQISAVECYLGGEGCKLIYSCFLDRFLLN